MTNAARDLSDGALVGRLAVKRAELVRLIEYALNQSKRSIVDRRTLEQILDLREHIVYLQEEMETRNAERGWRLSTEAA